MARETEALLRARNLQREEFEFIGYVVSDLNRLRSTDSRDQVVGDYEWLSKNRHCIDAIAVGIGSPLLRVKVAAEVMQLLPNAEWPYLIHPSARLDVDTAKFSEGVFIGAGVVGTVNLNFGPFALCNFGCTVGHEVALGSGSVINPGANVSGGVSIGDEVLVGSGAQILQYLTIGKGATVGAGAVVTKDVAPGIMVIGVPAKPILK
jgi:sugar O-acyltransferase (sialic acid O-acetyltransferase NeuD family)